MGGRAGRVARVARAGRRARGGRGRSRQDDSPTSETIDLDAADPHSTPEPGNAANLHPTPEPGNVSEPPASVIDDSDQSDDGVGTGPRTRSGRGTNPGKLT